MTGTQPVTLCKHAGAAVHNIYEPRWHDRRVLLKVTAVHDHNIVQFSKSPTLPGWYYVSGKTVRKYSKQSNGRIDCYAVPLSEFVPFEPKLHCEHEL